MFFDSHTHLMDEQYDGIRDEIVENAKKNSVLYMANIGYNKETSVKAVEDAKKYDGVYAVVGIHPENVDDLDDDFKFIYELAKEPKVVAVGEIGLDYHYGGDAAKQKEIFVKQIQIANELGKPVVIHSRDADMDMLKILKENKIENGFVMHCFSSSTEVLKEVLKLGAYVSLAGPVTFKNARSLIDVAKLIPEDRLLIETDAPYLAPEPFRGKRNEAAYVVHTAQKIADLRECSLEKIAEITTRNAKRFYKIES
ncbi:MAG: TatD family hydrolase [Clostridia bacterium]|nr:TatD family hydrolase [Clostridia bacterium]